MLDVRFSHLWQPISLDQFNDAPKTRSHVRGEGLEFCSNAIVEQLHDPRHAFIILHFCNIRHCDRPLAYEASARWQPRSSGVCEIPLVAWTGAREAITAALLPMTDLDPTTGPRPARKSWNRVLSSKQWGMAIGRKNVRRTAQNRSPDLDRGPANSALRKTRPFAAKSGHIRPDHATKYRGDGAGRPAATSSSAGAPAGPAGPVAPGVALDSLWTRRPGGPGRSSG
jgi:hypothetical protein